MKQFHIDYQTSLAKEQAFEQHLQSVYGDTTENTSTLGVFPFYDIKATGRTGNVDTYEIKYNKDYGCDIGKCEVCIEAFKMVNDKRLDSGMSITTADWYVLCFEDLPAEWYVISTTKLREFIADNKNIHKRIVHTKTGYMLHIFERPWLLSKCSSI